MKSDEPLQSQNKPILSLNEMRELKESLSIFTKFITSKLMTEVDNKKAQLFM